jgi:hypothetical protein
MLGNLIYEGKGRITGSRVLNVKESKIEYTLVEEGKFKDTDVTITSTFWTIHTSKDTVYGEAQAIFTANDGRETGTYRGCGIGYFIEQGKTIFRGTNFYKTSPTNRKLSFLNNVVGAFEAEAYENRHSGKVWEWK